MPPRSLYYTLPTSHPAGLMGSFEALFWPVGHMFDTHGLVDERKSLLMINLTSVSKQNMPHAFLCCVIEN